MILYKYIKYKFVILVSVLSILGFFVINMFGVIYASSVTISCQDMGNAISNYSGSSNIPFDTISASEVSSAPSGTTSSMSFDYSNGVVSNCSPVSLNADTTGQFVYTISPVPSSSAKYVTLYYTASSTSANSGSQYSPTTISNLENPVSKYNNNFVSYTLNKVVFPILYGVLGFIVLGLVSYAGFLWMTSKGDPKSIDKAKSVLTGAIIGAIIIMLAYIISLLLVSNI